MRLRIGDNLTVFDISFDDRQIGMTDDDGVLHWFELQDGDEYSDDDEEDDDE